MKYSILSPSTFSSVLSVSQTHSVYVSLWFKLKTVVTTSKRGFVPLCLKVLFTLKEAAIFFLRSRVITETM